MVFNVLVTAVIADIFVKPFSFPLWFYVFQSENLTKQLKTQFLQNIQKCFIFMSPKNIFFQTKSINKCSLYFC